jgi:hypothetical protein
MAVQSVKELTVYRKSYALAMRVFELSKRFPKEELFALTGQICRSHSPLTPALSPGESVNRRLRVRLSAARWFAAARDTVLPLPGERAGVRGNKVYENTVNWLDSAVKSAKCSVR